MKHLKLFEEHSKVYESRNTISNAILHYKQTLDKEKMAEVSKLKSMLNLDIQEGPAYAASQYDDYEGWDKTLDKLRDLVNELDLSDIYYCDDTDEVTTTSPEEDEESGFSWMLIDASDVKKGLLGAVSEYV